MYEHEFMDGFIMRSSGSNLEKCIEHDEFINLVWQHGGIFETRKIKIYER